MQLRLMSGGRVCAVAVEEVQQFGCAHCGCETGKYVLTTDNTAAFSCSECRNTTLVLREGTTVSSIGIGGDHYPEVQAHPRRGTPSHPKS
jgi:hypothetical protein